MARTKTQTDDALAEALASETAPAPEVSEKGEKGETAQQAKNRLRNEAERIVIDRHRDEFYAEAERLYEANGFEFKRRLTEEEKAAQQIEKLLQANPALREQYAPTTMVVDPAPADA